MRDARTLRVAAAGACVALLAACAAAPRVPGPTPVLLDEQAIRSVARLVELEDRRDFRLDVLEAAAADPRAELRRRAALAAGRFRRVEGLPLLARLLADPDTATAATAAFAMGLIGDTAAVPHLSAWLAPERAASAPSVAAEAAAALGSVRSPAAAEALQAWLEAAPSTGGRLPAVEHALLAAWRHPRPRDLAHLVRWTAAEHPEVRWRAVYALVRRPDPRSVPRLLELATDPAPEVRSLAVRGLARTLVDSAGVSRPVVLDVLLAASADPHDATAINAIRSLGGYSEPGSMARLESLLDSEPARAVAAAESLGRLGVAAAGAEPSLRRVALDPRFPIGLRSAALQALAGAAPGSAGGIAESLAGDADWRVRLAAGRALASLSPLPRPALDSLVRDADPRVGAGALGAMVDAAGDSVRPLRGLLLESLAAADVQIRTAALRGLARLRDPATAPALLDALERSAGDADNDAALAALDALAALQDAGVPVARSLVQRIARPDDYLVRRRAGERFGEPLRTAWGAPLPIETGWTFDQYVAIVRARVAPVLAGGPRPAVLVETESGAFRLRLFAVDAPLTVENFLRLAARGYFDGQEWPRVVPNFVIQGGDPRGDQTGGPGYAIRDELNRHRYGRGTLGMALSGPDTGGSQFFVTHSPQPHLDGGYTVFGEVVDGMEVVDRVRAGERILRIREVP